MRHRHDGLAYELVLPATPPRGGVVVLHGAGSCKENHRDFARRCAAAGLATIVFDQRGHGASDGALDGRALEDVATIAARLPDDVPVFLRGSSMGGFIALAAAAHVGAAGVVAVCPAGRELLLGALREDRLALGADRAALKALIQCPRGGLEVIRGRLHAAAPGSRLIAVPGGDHTSAQHDPSCRPRRSGSSSG